MDALAQDYTMPTKLKCQAIQHGQTYESEAVKLFEAATHRVVSNCGIFVQPEHPYLASSPDGIIDDKTLLEVKCPYTARDKDITPDNIPYLNDDNGSLSLDKSHDYYFQIQGQLYCAGRTECDFVVFTKKEIKIIKIVEDQAFIEIMLQKLSNFFRNHFQPALLNKYIYRNYYDYHFETKS